MDVTRLSAFALNGAGGNPAGVVYLNEFPSDEVMLAKAAEVGYSETVFAVPGANVHRLRYFAPEQEVPFCGHATIAFGASLGARHGAGSYALELNDAAISVDVFKSADGDWGATLTSPGTWSKPMPVEVRTSLLDAFSLSRDDLDPSIPASIASAGAIHAVLPLKDRDKLAQMRYDFDPMRDFMVANTITTISLVHAESASIIHARNPFAFGGVYEDPATGAAAAALGGLLRDIDWPAPRNDDAHREVEIFQGADMGVPSYLKITFDDDPGGPIRVSGGTRPL